MSDYRRLTNNNLEEYDPEYDFCMGCEYYGKYHSCDRPNGICANFERFIQTYNRLAELEDKIENGTLIELPCKVDTIVYQICKECPKCSHFKVTDFDCYCENNFDSEDSKRMFKFDGDKDCIYSIREYVFTYNDIEDFGENLFLTKPEAEAKLEQIRKGEV